MLLQRVADLLVRDRPTIAQAESLDTGKRLVESEMDVDDVVRVFRYYAELADADAGRRINPIRGARPSAAGSSTTGWRLRADHAMELPAPADLLEGRPGTGRRRHLRAQAQRAYPVDGHPPMRMLDEAGLPPGVANLVLGSGPRAGAPLVESPLVDLVSFTGGLATGKAVMAAAAGTVKKVALELGGKNPNVVFADADVETALDYALTAVFLHSGQVCSAGAGSSSPSSSTTRSSTSWWRGRSGSAWVARSTRAPRPGR